MSLNNTNITSMEIVLTNIDFCRQIVKFLDYKHQLNLLKVSRALRYIITDYIWNIKFKEVEVRVCNQNNFVVTNKICNEEKIVETLEIYKFNLFPTCAMHLNQKDMEIFFNLNKNNIQKLKIAPTNKRELVQAKFLLKHKFENLKYLSFWNFYIANEHLRFIAENCKNIETVIFSRCKNTSLLVENNSLQIMETLQNLKTLKITETYLENFLFNNVVNLVNRLKLQHLKLYSVIQRNDLDQYQLDSHKLKDYKVFHIEPKFNRNNSFSLGRNFLTHFENLNNLSIRSETIDNGFFNILLKSCGNLKQLHLNECEINNFTALPKLQKIVFNRCRGLTYRDLEITMNEMNLKSFSAILTNFGDESDIDTFPVSPTLLCCQIEHKYGFKKINTKLMKLRKLYLNIFTYYRNIIRLEFAPNLIYLYIDLKTIEVETIFELKYLVKLVILNIHSHEMEELTQLLKHENLKELSILNYTSYVFSTRETEAVTTNILYFKIDDSMMEHETNFVLDLLNVNPKLSLECFVKRSDTAYVSLIKNILLNAKFPRHFKTINICGFVMDCAEIRSGSRKFFETVKLFQYEYSFVLK